MTIGLVRTVLALTFVCFVAAIDPSAQTVTTVANFDGTDGLEPWGSLVQGFDGNLYGASQFGGGGCFGEGCGTVFKLTPGGSLSLLYNFCTGCTAGYIPTGGLTLATNGQFYGTTQAPYGTVFKITPQGKISEVHSFCSQPNCTDGASPYAGVLQATNGSFYGTTFEGGANCPTVNGCGTVFELTPSGVFKTLYSFCSQSNCTDGKDPAANLIQGTDGNLYGTVQWGGACNGCGTFFKIALGGALTTLYQFCSLSNCADGSNPDGTLVQATDCNFYGTTIYGGTNNSGTIFKITPTGKLTTLHTFCSQANCEDGSQPNGSLIQATDGDLYGTTGKGGANCISSGGCGTIFKVTLQGNLTTLYSFCAQPSCADGEFPDTGLTQATSGIFYGGAANGSLVNQCDTFTCGMIYSLSTGLGSFVETLPTSGKVGIKVAILGNNLKGTTSVTFNGVSAVFTVASNTHLTATVPTGATSGLVQVTTSGGVLKSNSKFVVH